MTLISSLLSFQYLEKRFSKGVRIYGAFVYMVFMVSEKRSLLRVIAFYEQNTRPSFMSFLLSLNRHISVFLFSQFFSLVFDMFNQNSYRRPDSK